MMTHDEVLLKVQTILVDALGVEEEDVTPDATLFAELGAESIDLLDIVFRLERGFTIKIPRGELFPEPVNDPELVEGSRLTAQGLQAIRQQMPYTDLSVLEADPRVDRLFELYTVETLVRYVRGKLESQEEES